jgi:hypothetical protein
VQFSVSILNRRCSPSSVFGSQCGDRSKNFIGACGLFARENLIWVNICTFLFTSPWIDLVCGRMKFIRTEFINYLFNRSRFASSLKRRLAQRNITEMKKSHGNMKTLLFLHLKWWRTSRINRCFAGKYYCVKSKHH